MKWLDKENDCQSGKDWYAEHYPKGASAADAMKLRIIRYGMEIVWKEDRLDNGSR